jgi:hypothetical protein
VTDRANDWRPELERLELSLLWAWIEGPSFRSRWTPEPREFSTDRCAEMARACQAMVASGLRSSLAVQFVDALRSSGALNKFWPFGRGLESNPSATPDEDLSRWRTLRIRFALRQRLVELVSTMTLGGDLSRERRALLEAITGTSVSGAIPAISRPDGMLAALQDSSEAKGRVCSSGFPDLDLPIGGLRPGHVWVIGAPTNWGKSSLLLALADHHLQTRSTGALLVTCEDAPSLLFSRWLAKRAGVGGRALRDGELGYRDREAAVQAVGDARDKRPVMLDGRGCSVEQIAREIAAHVAAHSIRLVLVDYLQCITADRVSQDRRSEINHVARTLTDAIKTSGAAGVLASQLTGEDIRESRDVEHAAEVVLIGRGNATEGHSLFLKKNKTGPADSVVRLEWDRNTGSFVTETQWGIRDHEDI